MEMEIGLNISDTFCNVRRKLEGHAFAFDSFSYDKITGIMDICGHYLKLGGHTRIFCSVVQFLFRFKADSAAMASAIFEDYKGSEQKRKEAMFEEEN